MRPIPTTTNDGCLKPPHATSSAPAPQSLGCRTWRCSHLPGMRPIGKPCRPRTAHASQSVSANSTSGSRKIANDGDMVKFPGKSMSWFPRSSFARLCGWLRLDLFVPKRLGRASDLESLCLSLAATVHRCARLSSAVRGRCHAVRHARRVWAPTPLKRPQCAARPPEEMRSVAPRRSVWRVLPQGCAAGILDHHSRTNERSVPPSARR